MSRFYCVNVSPCAAGSGEYEQGRIESQDAYESAIACLDACREGLAADIYEIGEDELPKGLPNICGAIHNAAGRLFGYASDAGAAQYFAIVECE